MDSDGARLIERVAACLPCYSCGGGRSWQLWPGEFDDDAQPILTAPTPALAECLIPPSMPDPFRQQSRAPNPDATWASSDGAGGQHMAASDERQADGRSSQPVNTGFQSSAAGASAGIELKEAAANPLLGQFHLEAGGQFVKAKLPAAGKLGPKAAYAGNGHVESSSSSRGSTPKHPEGQQDAYQETDLM